MSVCVSGICTCVSCSIAIKRDGGIRGQVIAVLTSPVLRFAESYSSISTFSFVDDHHFLVMVSIDFQFLLDLIGSRSTIEFKLIIIIKLIYSCASSNMVAEGIGGQA